MAQIQKGYEFDSSNPVKNIVTDDNLNSLVSNATLLNGAIIEQTANAVTADTDIMLLSKAGSLIKQTKAQFTDTINSNIANINTVNAALVDADDVDTVDATLTGNLAVGGNSAMTGNLAVTGNVTVTGLVTASTVPTTSGHLTNKTYVDGTFSKATNGYCILPNGIIMQWATGVVGSGLQVINFPIPFPTAVFSIIVSTKAENNDANDNMFQEWSNTLTSVSIYDQTFGGAGNYANVPRVFAIGH